MSSKSSMSCLGQHHAGAWFGMLLKHSNKTTWFDMLFGLNKNTTD